MKWWFKFCDNGDVLWKKVVRYVYNLPEKILTLPDLAPIKHGPLYEISKVTSKLSWLQLVINDVVHIKLGQGNKIIFWTDQWLPSGPLNNQFPTLFSISNQQTLLSLVWVYRNVNYGSGTLLREETFLVGKKPYYLISSLSWEVPNSVLLYKTHCPGSLITGKANQFKPFLPFFSSSIY